MRLFCWNINSLAPTVRNINLKYGSLAAFFAHLDADIVCMQEVKLPDSKLSKELVVVEGYQSYWACSESKTGYSGVTTWARNSFAATSAEADPFAVEGCDKEGRVVVTDHTSFVLFNVYVPNAGDRPDRVRLAAKLSFLTALRQQVDELLGAGRQVVLVGDFNVAAEKRDAHDACTWGSLYDPAELAALHALMGPTGSNCTDSWRHLHPDTDGIYTVWSERTSARAFNVGLRIDYALVSAGLLSRVVSSEVLLDLPPKWSDHAPLMLHMDLPAPCAATPAAAAAQDQQQQAQQPQAQQQQQQPSGQQQEGQQQLQQQQLPAPPECPMWQRLLRRFNDPSQRSIASMFSRAAAKPKPAAAAKQVAAAAAAAGGGTGQQSLQQLPADVVAAPSTAGGSAKSQQQQQQQPQPQQDAQGHHFQPQQDQLAPQHSQPSSQPMSQSQPQEQPQQQNAQSRKATSSSGNKSSKSASRQQQSTGSKRKAGSKADAAAAKDSKQKKLDSFFGRAASSGSKGDP